MAALAPRGKMTTCGQVAEAAGFPGAARVEAVRPHSRETRLEYRKSFNAGARIRTWELLREQILSLPPLAARPPRRCRREESATLILLPFLRPRGRPRRESG